MINQVFLNHIARPTVSALQLIALGRELGLAGVELRNDIGDGDPLSGASPAAVKAETERFDQHIFSINALQRCNDRSIQNRLFQDLEVMVGIAEEIGIPAIVLCPVNDRAANQNGADSTAELIDNLRAFAPLLEDHGIVGLVEPLGFATSSLRSQEQVIDAIAGAGRSCFKLLLDTFHFAIGPDDFSNLESYPIESIGLVHLSGVSRDLPKNELTDADRILPGPSDELETSRQIRTLAARGYAGPYSFEPFSPNVQSLQLDAWKTHIRRSLSYLQSAGLNQDTGAF